MEKRVGKYLLYAAGEIFLVMIGILLAMNVNNWNESRKELNQERALVVQLLEDAEADSAFFENRLYYLTAFDSLYTCVLWDNDSAEYAFNGSEFAQTGRIFFFTRLANQSNVINNNPDAYELLSDETLKRSLRRYSSRYEYVFKSLELANEFAKEKAFNMEMKYLAQIQELAAPFTSKDFEFIHADEDAMAIVYFMQGLGSNGREQVAAFIEANAELIAALRSYLK